MPHQLTEEMTMGDHLKRLWSDERGATTLEWTMLLAAIALPSYLLFKTALTLLIYQYQMITLLNSLPFP